MCWVAVRQKYGIKLSLWRQALPMNINRNNRTPTPPKKKTKSDRNNQTPTPPKEKKPAETGLNEAEKLDQAPHPMNLVAPHLMVELRSAGFIEICGDLDEVPQPAYRLTYQEVESPAVLVPCIQNR